MNSPKRKNSILTYRLEVPLQISRKGVLPKCYLIGELGLGDGESFGRDVNGLGAKLICEMNKGQGNNVAVDTLSGGLSVRRGYEVDSTGFHTVVAEVDIGCVAVVQPLERA